MEASLQDKTAPAFGTYQVVGELAQGVFATVYKAHDPATGEPVAIKHASDKVTRDEVLLKRFEQEYRATSNLNHPNIVQSLDFGWTDERPYIVMEFVDGEDLWSKIDREGRLPEAEAVQYVIQVARGLHLAHQRGIIHRDIKPDNILLTADGQAKLADLGLSKDLEADLGLTRPARGLGTPCFMAPEQFTDAKHAGVRCDIYSLGATLYMALTGEAPFAAAKLSGLFKQKLGDVLVPPRQLAPDVSEHVDWAVRRAVQADARRRFRNCPEFIAALRLDAGDLGAGLIAMGSRPAGRSHSGATKVQRERRGAERFDCTLATSCRINLSLHPNMTECQTQWEAQVQSLSASGIGLHLSRRFEPGSILTVELTSSAGDVVRIREIRVVRVARMPEGGWFLGGILTEELSKEELRLLL
jgi:serine/threonine protein kinase